MKLPINLIEYLDEVRRMADKKSYGIVSIGMFGSIIVGGFSRYVSDVDLLVVLADGVPRKSKHAISCELEALEIKHGLREYPTSRLKHIYSVCDRKIGGFNSITICYKRDLLSENAAAIFDVNPVAEFLLVSWHTFIFSQIIVTTKTIWGEDFISHLHLPAITKGHLIKNCILNLIRNVCSFLGYPILPNATKYAMSILKGFIQNCYFVYTSRTAPIEEEIDFFRTKLGERKAFTQLLLLRREYRSSLGFIASCFRVLVQLYAVTVRENKFPITVGAKRW